MAIGGAALLIGCHQDISQLLYIITSQHSVPILKAASDQGENEKVLTTMYIKQLQSYPTVARYAHFSLLTISVKVNIARFPYRILMVTRSR